MLKRVYKGMPGRGNTPWPGRIEVSVAGKEDDDRPYYPRTLDPPRKHSPDGFAWGYGGSGPADTAYAILKDVLGTDPLPTTYMKFKFDVVSKLPNEFELTDEEVIEWLERHTEGLTKGAEA